MRFGAMGARGGFGGMGTALGRVAVPAWVLRPGGIAANVDMDFANALYYGGTLSNLLSCSRGSSATDLLPSSASGYAYNTFGSNVPAVSPGVGLLAYPSRTNLFLNSTAPVTQTITLPATGNYTLWPNGSGSAAIAAGTATITGAGTATNGSPVTINCTVTGTVTVTVTGSLNFCQLESGAYGTSGIVTAGASASRSGDVIILAGAALSLVMGTVYSIALQSSAATPNAGGQLIDISNANVASDIGLWRNGANITFERNGATQALVYAPSYHYAASADLTTLQGAQNNVLATVVSSAKVAVTKATIGINRTANAAAAWSAPINRIALFNSALSSANTQAASA